MRRRAAQLLRTTGIPVGLFFLGGLIGRASRGRRRRPAPERMLARHPSLYSTEPPHAGSWSPETSSMQAGGERASVLGYQRSVSSAPPPAAEPGFTIGGDGAMIRKPAAH